MHSASNYNAYVLQFVLKLAALTQYSHDIADIIQGGSNMTGTICM